MKYWKINTSEREISVSSVCVFIAVQVRFGLLCLATVVSLWALSSHNLPMAHSVTVSLLPLTLHRHTLNPSEKPSADKRDPEERFGQSHSVQSVLSQCSRQPQRSEAPPVRNNEHSGMEHNVHCLGCSVCHPHPAAPQQSCRSFAGSAGPISSAIPASLLCPEKEELSSNQRINSGVKPE